jgi:Glycosyl hydrolase family 20, catalytic domain/beta-acetyl hexosaminidase like
MSSFIRRLLFVIAATQQYCRFVAFTLALHRTVNDDEPQKRLWNDSFIWPAPQSEIYERMRTADDTKVDILRVLFYNKWEFVYDVLANENDDSACRWKVVMTAAQERFQQFLSQSILNPIRSDNRHMDDDDGRKRLYRPYMTAELIPFEGIRFHISNTSETTLWYGMDESYVIQILNPSFSSDVIHATTTTTSSSIQNTSNFIEISSTNVYGAIYALETLKQLLQFGSMVDDDSNNTTTPVFYVRNHTFKLYIHDAPVFMYRGIMIDTARHYLPLSMIQQNLYIMAANKLNVLHWHMTDSQSFPYASGKFPELAQYGAYCYPECTYNATDIRMIIDIAALLGIHVIVEIDLPTHSQGTNCMILREGNHVFNHCLNVSFFLPIADHFSKPSENHIQNS